MEDINKINKNYKINEINRPGSLPEPLNKNIKNLTLTKIKKFPTNFSLFPKKNVYLKGKIKKQTANVPNNIIINNNTNIINNNNINIINNNIINTDDKELNRSMSQLNLLPIPKSEYNNNNNNNINIQNKNIPTTIFNKRKISLNSNATNNYKNNLINKTHMLTLNSNFNQPGLNEIKNKQKNNLSDKKNIINNNDNNKPLNNTNNKKNTKENNAILNVEEILMIEEKLSSLINCLNNNNPCAEESFECINFYFTTKFSKNIDNYFPKENIHKIINKALKIKIFSFIICYDISLNEDIFGHYISILKQIFSNVHNILILISKYFCNKTVSNHANMWVKKLNNLTYRYDPKVKSVNAIFDEINSINNKLMQKLYPNLLQLYKKPILYEIFGKLETLTQLELQRIYKERIFVNMNINGSIIGSSAYFQKNKNYLNYSNNNKNIYFLNKKPTKNYTLVLDLDETLIHFKSNPNDDNSGLLQFRPFINEFLFGVSKFYELIVFTAATEDYADPIIDAIEKKGIKFEKRLYRIHTVVINNDFVKDLSRLGRDLSRTIIVDNMEQNYKLQPENGITIRPFWGKDANDMALVDLLGILKEIAKNKMDVRAGISYFKEDIISKVTSNIFRRVQI